MEVCRIAMGGSEAYDGRLVI